VPKLASSSLPTIWVDSMQMLVREAPPVVMLRFFTFTPEAAIEIARLQTPVTHIRQMIDVMARSINYYPQRPAPPSPTP